jgi:NTE family protein
MGGILVDGGLTNPVPVSAVRTMGADIVIAVDLNHEIVAGKNLKPLLSGAKTNSAKNKASSMFPRWAGDYLLAMKDIRHKLFAEDVPALAQFRAWTSAEPLPSIFEVLLASINIMETHLTQTRLSIDRPDIIIQPPLGHIRFLEFDRAEEIITAGYEHTQQKLASLVVPGQPV